MWQTAITSTDRDSESFYGASFGKPPSMTTEPKARRWTQVAYICASYVITRNLRRRQSPARARRWALDAMTPPARVENCANGIDRCQDNSLHKICAKNPKLHQAMPPKRPRECTDSAYSRRPGKSQPCVTLATSQSRISAEAVFTSGLSWILSCVLQWLRSGDSTCVF